MANAASIYDALSACGFESSGRFYFGTWGKYALLLQPNGNSLYTIVSVDLPNAWGSCRKALNRAAKEKRLQGLKFAGLTKITASFLISFGKAEDPSGFFKEALNTLTAILSESGIEPPATCAISGAADPDSLSIVSLRGAMSYRPVCAAAVRDQDAKAREKVEDNQLNGSYGLGVVGALLGMLLGLIPNLLTIVFTERIYGVLFALVPIFSMLGYKLFRGKMSKGALVIVILLSLLGVPVIEFANLVIYLIREYGAELGEAISYTAQLFRMPDFLSEAATDFLQLLVFMAIGVAIAWRFMSGQINSSQLLDTETQLATLRPNPARAQAEEPSAY